MIAKHFIVNLLLSFVLSVATLSSGAEENASVSKVLRERILSAPSRELKAATRVSHLAKRHTSFFTVKQIELTYTESECSWP